MDESETETNHNSHINWLQYNYKYPHHEQAIDERGQRQQQLPSSFTAPDFFMDLEPVGFPNMTTYFHPPSSNSTVNLATTHVGQKAASSIGKPRRLPPRGRDSQRPPPTILNANINNFRSLVHQYTGYHDPPPYKNSPAVGNLISFGSSRSHDQQHKGRF